MSYYEPSNGQWPTQNTWDHQVPPTRSGMSNPLGIVLGTSVLTCALAGTNGPSSQDEFAFFYQFDGMRPPPRDPYP
ncbi:hypothetical protein IMZ48_18135 [Candidatus Bathyarchaeota archaeon]|nr:hypothetical protein [Candidatus Bathyarchaeota archaeon]